MAPLEGGRQEARAPGPPPLFAGDPDGSLVHAGSHDGTSPLTGSGPSAASSLPPVRKAPGHERSDPLAGGNSTWSSISSGVRPSRLAEKLGVSVLAAKGAEALLSQPGGPPRAPIGFRRAPASDSEDAEASVERPARMASTFSPRVKTPRMRRRRELGRKGSHELSTMQSSQQDTLFSSVESSSHENSGRLPDIVQSTGSFPRKQASKWSAHSSFTALSAREPRELRPPSPLSVVETLYARGQMGKSFNIRGDFDEAIQQHEAKQADKVRARIGARGAAQEVNRQSAALWRESHERKRQVCELRWRCQDSKIKQLFEVPGCEEGRHCPSPQTAGDGTGHWQTGDEVDNAKPTFAALKGGAVLKQPVAARMKMLKKIARQRRKAELVAMPKLPPKKPNEDKEDDSDEDEVGSAGRHRSDTEDESGRQSSRRSSRIRGGPVGQTSDGRRTATRRGGGIVYSVGAAELRQAFIMHDTDGSDTLDHSELMECMSDLGLRAKSEGERSAIRSVILGLGRLHFNFQEFSNVILPEVRQRLQEIREVELRGLWGAIAEDFRQEGLSPNVQEVLGELRRRAVTPSQAVLDASLKAFAREVGHDERVVDVRKAWVDQERFRSLFRILQERIDMEESELFHKIVKNFNLTPEDEESWRFDLVELWRMFHENDPTRCRYGSGTGFLDEQQMLNVIRHSGYVQHIPRHTSRLFTVGNLMSKHSRPDRTMGFTNFLEVCRALREFDRDRLRRIFDNEMKSSGKPGVADRSEVKDMLIRAEVVTAGIAETWEVRAEIEDCSLDGSGALSREDIVLLAQRIGMKLQVIEHETEKQYMEAVGWNADNMVEFRRAFDMFDDDMSDYLDEQELVRAMELLKGPYSQSAQETTMMFMALGVDPNYHVQVNFLTFLRMIKMLEHSEARRSLGGKLGLDQDSIEKISRVFQKFNHGRKFLESGLPMARVEQVMRGNLGVWLSRAQLADILEQFSEHGGFLAFPDFLKLMKSVETLLGDNFQECLEDLLQSHGDGAQTTSDKKPEIQAAAKPASRRGCLADHIA